MKIGKLWKLDWLKNNEEDESVQSKLVEECKEQERVIQSHTQIKGRMWACVNQATLERLCIKNKGIFEIIREKDKRKVYFDVDAYDFDPIEIAKQSISAKFPNARLQISGSVDNQNKKGTKYSYHIVLSNYFFNSKNDEGIMKL